FFFIRMHCHRVRSLIKCNCMATCLSGREPVDHRTSTQCRVRSWTDWHRTTMYATNEGSDHAGQREEKELRCGTSDVALSRRSAVWICDGYGRRRLRRLGRPRSRRTARKRQVLGQEARRTRWDDEFPSHRWLV